jgi:His/Glu/Gln/Arg/opine family amino acid ABC transporter permease subunit
MSLDTGMMLRAAGVLLDGAGVTLELSALAIVLALAWGLPVVGARLSRRRLPAFLAAAYIELMRNTPVLVQMYFLFFGFSMAGLRMTGWQAGLLALVLQNGAYVAEIYRAGIADVGRRQREAGLALGMRPFEAFRIVIFPQAVRRVLPPLGSQFVLIIKDTALVSTLSVAEMTFHARLLTDRTAAAYEIFFTLALFYLAITGAVALAMRVVERRVGAVA